MSNPKPLGNISGNIFFISSAFVIFSLYTHSALQASLFSTRILTPLLTLNNIAIFSSMVLTKTF